MNKTWLAPAGLAAALMIAACGSSTSSTGSGSTSSAAAPATSAAASSGTLKTTKIGGVAVLTNAKGFTLYSFVPDTSTKSNCNGSCATYWPPGKGPATAGTGV